MNELVTIDPKELTTGVLHGYLLGAVGPRPIAFASTLSTEGVPNLAPFSFFNVFSANPPILIFSPARRVRDNTTKHTLENVLATKEVVINVVNYDTVQQMSLASTEYGAGENEFVKSGLTMLPSEVVAPFRVAESPVQFECKVTKVEALGNKGGAGNLVFAEVVRIHIHKTVLNEKNGIDQHKIDLVARMGGNWYSRANMGMFEVPKPLSSIGIGVDSLPSEVRNSSVLTGNNLGLLANVSTLPSQEEIQLFLEQNTSLQPVLNGADVSQKHKIAQDFLNNNNVSSAWKVLLANKQ